MTKAAANTGIPSTARRVKGVHSTLGAKTPVTGVSGIKRGLKAVSVENMENVESPKSAQNVAEIAGTENQHEEKPVKTKRTITLNQEAEDRVRIWAAEHKTTVSLAIEQLICKYLD